MILRLRYFIPQSTKYFPVNYWDIVLTIMSQFLSKDLDLMALSTWTMTGEKWCTPIQLTAMLEMRASSRLRANRNYNTAGNQQIIQSFATCTSPMMHLIWPAGGAALSKTCKWWIQLFGNNGVVKCRPGRGGWNFYHRSNNQQHKLTGGVGAGPATARETWTWHIL